MKHFNEQISKAKTIAITGHIHPDGDCIGSCLALKQYILDNYSGKKVDVYLESISTEFRFLSHAQEIITESKDDESYDLFFVLDCGSEDRYEPFAAMVRCAKTLIGIDHHISNDGFGDFYKIDPQASATCERKTMEYAGMLLEKGVSTTKIIDETFYQKTFVQNQLLGKALLKSQLYADGQIIISNLSEQDFEELHASTSDSDGIIDQLRITKAVEAAIFLYPIENGYKVSMRSNEKVKVSEIAKTHGGGGHIRAAGCSMKGTLKDIQSTIISEITEQL